MNTDGLLDETHLFQASDAVFHGHSFAGDFLVVGISRCFKILPDFMGCSKPSVGLCCEGKGFRILLQRFNHGFANFAVLLKVLERQVDLPAAQIGLSEIGMNEGPIALNRKIVWCGSSPPFGNREGLAVDIEGGIDVSSIEMECP